MEEAKEMVLARLHMRAVLPLLEDIAAFDGATQELTKGWDGIIQFQIPGKIATALIFDKGTLEIFRGDYKGSKATLSFPTARNLNEVFQGKTKKEPVPNLTALKHLSKLTKIENLLKRLEYYLKPDPKILKDPTIKAFCLRLKIYVLAFGLKQVGEHDPELKIIAPTLRNGIVQIGVKNGVCAHIAIENGKLYPAKGAALKPNALMEINDFDTAWDMVEGNLDLFAAVGTGRIKLRGYIALLEGINPLLDRLSWYLA